MLGEGALLEEAVVICTGHSSEAVLTGGMVLKKPETLLYFCLISQESQIGILSLYNSNSWKCIGLKCIFFKKATLIAILEVYEDLLFAGCILYDLSLNGTRNSELPTYLLLNIWVHCRAFCCCSFVSLFFSPRVSYLFDESPLIIFLP